MNLNDARVVELVDTRDLKSLDRNIVPVQVRPRVPYLDNYAQLSDQIARYLKKKGIDEFFLSLAVGQCF